MQNGRPARESRDARPGRSAGRSAPKFGSRDGARSSRTESRGVRDLGARSADADANAEPTIHLVRLNKYLASHGIASRRGCDELIADGAVMIDDAIVTDLGVKIDPTRHRVEVDGVVLKPEGVRHRYYLLNKPSGVVCTNSERELRPRAVDLITDRDKGRIFTVGRLDEETTGLILVTNDGEFANRVMHPRYGVDKTYRVKIAGKIEDGALNKIRGGVHLSEGKTSGARVVVQKRSATTSRLLVTIQEGKNREVRRMFARSGFKVTDLRRVRIGPLTDRGLKPGSWRPLRRFEIEELLAGPDARRAAEDAAGRGRSDRGRSERGDRRDGGRRGGDQRPGSRSRSGGRAGGARRSRHLEEAPSFERRVVGEDAGPPWQRGGRSQGGRGDGRGARGRGANDAHSGVAASGSHPAFGGSNRAARRTALEERDGVPGTSARRSGGGRGAGREGAGRKSGGRRSDRGNDRGNGGGRSNGGGRRVVS